LRTSPPSVSRLSKKCGSHDISTSLHDMLRGQPYLSMNEKDLREIKT
jgi:hypothetical protein